MTDETQGTIPNASGQAIAYMRLAGRSPGVVFLGGFRSDMTGTKAEDLARFCGAEGQAFLRFDYTGHGASEGAFEHGTIGAWADDATLALDRLTTGPQILVGSSMGGWIALLLALRRPGRVRALVGIAPAPDFTETLMEPAFTPEQRATLERDGVLRLPGEYGEPTPITRALIEEGRRHSILHAPIPVAAPVRILQGMQDPDVPWRHALRLTDALAGPDVQLTLVKDGDHRLSRPQDLALLRETLGALLRQDAG